MFRKFISQNAFLYALLIVVGFTISCKKSKTEPDSNAVPQGTSGTRDELTKDSIYLYAQQTYYWNVGMPSYSAFNPRQYSSNNAVLAALKALPSTGGKDKYSFIDDGTVAGELGGVGGDFGFSVFFAGPSDLRIKYVYAGSPAGVQGLKRGYQITKINGSTDINTTDARIDYIVNAIFGTNPTVTLTVLKPDGTSQDVTITKASYSINPILFTKTYTIGAKKVGYIVFNSFTTNSATLLDAAFAQFATDGVSELVVDLRYNGGGSVATSEAFTNLIAPPSQNGKVMYTTYWTQTMQDNQATILQNQKFYAKGNDGVTRMYSYFDYSYKPTVAAGNQEVFAKRGPLNNLARVYFIVTSSTASASELLINNLKPVIDVKLIGKKTYGKPVGFFSIRIDKNDLYIPQFETKNQLNQGGYFDGMAVDKDIFDDVTKDFGDPTEKLLAQALYYSANGGFSSVIKDNAISSTSPLSKTQVEDLSGKLDHEFKGMIETRKLKFK
ncbi:C-terminal processing protease CtpA/Prc [Pedobacter sp. AK013]|uniref:S41 family peptidase n=1 Tax=Pedobacter sp. AK013 TaxID=2723071 RepID=UPI0016141C43|nr:S41 family peptidase [Pedobacter sp. AK013]MBB6238202.1 C-terminal processing protease CtpA/Prc [Pedobacter sp. AK013]